MLETRVLRYFLAVAREGSITAAAQSLHVTQPTLSRQLMDLEDELGQKLFVRGAHHVSLTPEGILLRKRASEILELVGKTESEFSSMGETVAGDVYIGSGETDVMNRIAEVIHEINNDYPDVHGFVSALSAASWAMRNMPPFWSSLPVVWKWRQPRLATRAPVTGSYTP